MGKFEVKEDFYLNDQPFKVISGSIHYFRVVPEYWRDRLEKLKNMGCNTVETYVPWNMHEPKEGEYCFTGRFDIRKFIQTAHEVGLYVIVRPAPYICAEWEFGGLPYWLLKDPRIKIRFNNPIYMEKVKKYFEHLLPQFVDLQIDNNGPIIMMQVENEYGGYANDLSYMRAIARLMLENGVTVPLVTSDGPWGDMLENGSIPELALPTVNCGSKIEQHFERLRDFHGKELPLMVMEFWVGWFDAWGDEAHHTTDAHEAAKELKAILDRGHVNIYMFHGGTNFGFTNGANYYEKLAPDVTSYDYDALLTEWGDTTKKYDLFKEVIQSYGPIEEMPLSTEIKKKDYGKLTVQDKVSLFSVIDEISQPVESNYPLSMEELDQAFGYVYYKSSIGKAREIEDFRLIGCMDRAHVFVNNELEFIKYDLDIEDKESFTLTAPENDLGILVENMGRVNYSVKMNHQHKGIRDGVVVNGAFQSDWTHYSLPLDDVSQIDFSKSYQAGTPAFYSFTFEVDEKGDTFLDFEGWGKGVAFINGFNLGRFWEMGPQKRLYIPAPLLNEGTNEIIIFETDGKVNDSISLVSEPSL
ncbi:glycoside hydrolase family 35 protein [Fundicoccus sp. Sow4_H7]|uniref:glycoside hydrolase family 35 protein n=1 Tax=Fundicoccus sp. Sow4_H7 TaxID=3438784 RepID=UPI003F8F6002